MTSRILACKYCGRDNFAGQRGLTQHQKKSNLCARLLANDLENNTAFQESQAGLSYTVVNALPTAKQLSNLSSQSAQHSHSTMKDLTGKMASTTVSSRTTENQYALPGYSADSEEEYAAYEEDNAPAFDVDDEVVFDEAKTKRRTELRDAFRQYSSYAHYNYVGFTPRERTAITLMHTLRKTKAPLSTYNDVMMWHLREKGTLKQHEKLGNTCDYITRQKLFRKLGKRYNINPDHYNVTKRRTLPSSKSTVNIICSDARALVTSILTDPRLDDSDYLFFDDDPLKPPPAKMDYIGDINTGLSYTATYKKLIKDPTKQMLMALPCYIDGATTGAFSNLPIVQFKITCGWLNQEARDKEIFWRVLGTVPKHEVAKSRGKRIMLGSRHADAVMAHQDILEEEGTRTAGKDVNNARDYHYILGVIFETLVQLQKDGMVIDFFYKGKFYKDMEVFFYIPHVKADNEEADKLCGKFGSRSGGVAQLCRQCHCPTEFTARAAATYPLKTTTEIKKLVDREELATLRNMSQHPFHNAFHKLRFGLHNKTGIHGACPIDMLHTIYLGLFMRTRDSFFGQVGSTSETTKELDGLAMEYGELLSRHSERDMPKTKFSKGITGGKIMAKEYEGVLLLLATLVRSSKGRRLLQSAKSGKFKTEALLADWQLLLETMLGWIMWLKSKCLQRKHVKAAEWKHRYLMYLMKRVLRRTEGMGMKIPKFHQMLHIAHDMLVHGNAASLDTGSNESGHKPTKRAALLTQKKPELFDLQTAQRLLEAFLLDMAMHELQGRSLWHYLRGYETREVVAPEVAEPKTGGTRFECRYSEETQETTLYVGKKMIGENGMVVETDFVNFVEKLQDKVARFTADKVVVQTEHKRNGVIFRAHPKYRGLVWRDWVEINWGDEVGVLPAKIWGFVDFSMLPERNAVRIAGLHKIDPGVYAIVESASYSTNQAEIDMSEIFVPVVKEVGRMEDGAVTQLKFYLADVEAFVAPLTVIPDIGGETNAYFMVRNRTCWREDFESWLETPKNENTFTMSDDEESDSDIDDAYLPKEKKRRSDETALEIEDDFVLGANEDASGDDDVVNEAAIVDSDDESSVASSDEE